MQGLHVDAGETPGGDEEFENTGLCGSSFRQMMAALMVLSVWISAVGGVTTGTLTALEDDFGFSTTELAMILVMYDVGALVSAVPGAHFGPKCLPRCIGAGTLLTAAGLGLFGAGSSLAQFCLGQFTCGFGGSCLWILGVVHIDDNCIDKTLVSTFTGWMMAVSPLGVIAGFVIAGLFLGECGSSDSSMSGASCGTADAPIGAPVMPPAGDCSGWRYPFFVLAGLLITPSIWYLLSKTAYEPPRTTRCCGDAVAVEDASPASPGSPVTVQSIGLHRGIIRGAKALVSNARVALLCLGAGMHSFQATAVISFGPRFMERQLCVSKASASLLTGTFVPIICSGMFAGGRIPTWRGWGRGMLRHKIMLMATTTLASAPLLVAAFFTDTLAAFLVLVMFALALMFAMMTPSITSVERVVKEEDRAAAVAAQNVIVRAAGGIPGPIALGAMLDSAKTETEERLSYVYVALAGIASAFVLWIAVWFLQLPYDRREQKEDVMQQQELRNPEVGGLADIPIPETTSVEQSASVQPRSSLDVVSEIT
eukprot:TRINITY_DN6343_c0_g2_i1.p1 TRINITY_DN6343_c0_g2~~TRINITY_DN6343_c0_g2_i1.p1  ORF type:complete len:538 (+),score=121.82 TRINITY_DN6343_c0_g2_i1:30-1643(+)